MCVWLFVRLLARLFARLCLLLVICVWLFGCLCGRLFIRLFVIVLFVFVFFRAYDCLCVRSCGVCGCSCVRSCVRVVDCLYVYPGAILCVWFFMFVFVCVCVL